LAQDFLSPRKITPPKFVTDSPFVYTPIFSPEEYTPLDGNVVEYTGL